MADNTEKQTPGAVARDAAIGQTVQTIVYIAVLAAVSWGMTGGRDKVIQAWLAVKRWREHRDPYAAEVAAFRRDISDISRGGAGPDTGRARGLYERDGDL